MKNPENVIIQCLYCFKFESMMTDTWLHHICLPQDIRSRAAHKDEVLTEVGAVRKHGNDKRKVERELFNELRRDKVDSIQKQQV